jgi:uncharacterized phage infection (PIP) family protein YhgE
MRNHHFNHFIFGVFFRDRESANPLLPCRRLNPLIQNKHLLGKARFSHQKLANKTIKDMKTGKSIFTSIAALSLLFMVSCGPGREGTGADRRGANERTDTGQAIEQAGREFDQMVAQLDRQLNEFQKELRQSGREGDQEVREGWRELEASRQQLDHKMELYSSAVEREAEEEARELERDIEKLSADIESGIEELRADIRGTDEETPN